MDFDSTGRVLAALEREGVRYVVVGAAAINLLGLPRATQVLDIFIAPEAGNVERLKAALRSVFDDPSIDEIKAEELLGEYPAVEYVPPQGTFHIDILTRLGVKFQGIMTSVATPGTLYRMKKGTVRLKDQADAALLKERFKIEDS
jgi:hypothetical protein